MMIATTHQTTTAASAELVPFAPVEQVTFDPEALTEFCMRHGEEAEDRIAEVLFKIEERLTLAAWQVDNGERRGLRRSAEMLGDLARQIGMVTLSKAAAAVIDSDKREDPAALAACAARLARLGERGRLAEWTLDNDGTVA